MKVKQIQKQYPNHWILVNVLKEDSLGEVMEADVIKVTQTEDKIHEEFDKLPDNSHVAILFTGRVLKKGQSFSLESM